MDERQVEVALKASQDKEVQIRLNELKRYLAQAQQSSSGLQVLVRYLVFRHFYRRADLLTRKKYHLALYEVAASLDQLPPKAGQVQNIRLKAMDLIAAALDQEDTAQKQDLKNIIERVAVTLEENLPKNKKQPNRKKAFETV